MSTDAIRHQLRGEYDADADPSLFVSTYQAADGLVGVPDDVPYQTKVRLRLYWGARSLLCLCLRQLLVVQLRAAQVRRGYKLQSRLVIPALEQIIDSYQEQNESIIVEGVHLMMPLLAALMKKYSNVIPFLVYISNPVG